MMTEQERQQEQTLKTYRYVRLAIVALVVGITGAVLVQRRKADGFLGSISAYYYTPARGMFVAALLAIGVCLVCVRGGTTAEDILLNAAGMLAPVVALVPTSPGKELLDPKIVPPARDPLFLQREAAVSNNWSALMWVAAFAFLVLLVLLIVKALGENDPAKRWPSRSDLIGFAAAAALVVAAVWWYFCETKGFLKAAHFTAAIAMFVFIAIAAIIDGARAILVQQAAVRGWVYIALGATMLLAGVGILGYDKFVQPWRHAVLIAEFVLIMLFGVIWAIQTVDLWNYTSRADAIEAAQLEAAAGGGVGAAG
jgi:preprotein translocase subunit SecG